MTVLVLIRRSVRPENVDAFRATYAAQRPNHEGFIAEYLTVVSDEETLHPNLRTLPLSAENAIIFVNVAFWRSAEDFEDNFKKFLDDPKQHDDEFEVAPRQRVVLEITGAVGDVIAGAIELGKQT